MKRSAGRASLTAIVVATFCIAMQPAAAVSDNSVVAVPLSSVPEGVSSWVVASTPVFMVRRDQSVTTYLTDPHGTPGLHVLWYCPAEQVFIEPAHAEAFDLHGRIIGGPARRGLDALETTVEDGSVRVFVRHRISGSTSRYDRDARARTQPGTYDLPGIYSGTGPWNSGPQSFCNKPIVAGAVPAPSLRRSVPQPNVSPAQPSSRAPDVEQGDTCTTFGATTFNKRGMVFDCEPWADGVNRWIVP